MIFVDTSAFFALTNSSDQFHEQTLAAWKNLIETDERLVCNNYVLVESFALIQRRAGLEAIKMLHTQILPMIEIEWFDQERHDVAVDFVLTTDRRKLSFVDCSSFTTMKRMGIQTAFTFDDHFREQGFKVIP